MPKPPQKKLDDAREIYLKHRGRNEKLIAKEMRTRGWTKFSPNILYRNGKRKIPGWIIQHGWLEMLSKEDRLFLKKRNIDRGFRFWLRWATPNWEWTWKYQMHLYRALDRVTKGDCRRLIITMPPRHGKSELITVRYAAWRLLKDPKLNIIIGSYNQKLANRFSRKIRQVHSWAEISATRPNPAANEPETDDALRQKIQRAQRINTAAEWETVSGGGVLAVGAGAGVTGFGANLIVIDDPIKGRADAENQNLREKVWEWFNDDIHTRLEPDAAIILIQTRWHDDDLAGRLIRDSKDGGEEWTVVSLPALAEPDDPLGRDEGAPLCETRFDRTALLEKKARIGSYSFSALYQQSPVPRDGGLFKREWFTRLVDYAPAGLRWFRGYDLAVSTKTSADFTASFRCAKDKNGVLYIADGFRGRIEYPEQRTFVIERMRAEKNTAHGIEEALHGRAFVQELRREIRLSGVPLRSIRVDNDKFTRALAWAPLAEAGKVVLVRGPWIEDFLEEVCTFPNAPHDDQVDAVSLAVNMMAEPEVDKKGYGF